MTNLEELPHLTRKQAVEFLKGSAARGRRGRLGVGGGDVLLPQALPRAALEGK